MECRSCTENMTAYLDGELDPEELNGVETHVSGCTTCREELDSLKFSYYLPERLRELDVSPSLWDGIYAGAVGTQTISPHSENFLRRIWQNRWIPLTAVAAGILAAFLMFIADPTEDAATEQRFTEFIRQREQISIQNRQLFSLETEHFPAANPFVKTVIYRNQNPFLQE